jgi:uncharacterized membrane protein
MTRTVREETSITIDAPIEVVWDVFSDVERWSSWTTSVTSVHLLDAGPLRIGSRARIRQPRLPKVVWTVTELEPGRSWTWTATSPGASTVASHRLSEVDGRTLAEQTIVQSGPIGALVGRLYRSLTKRYLALEAEGLRRQSEKVTASSS